MPGDVSLEMPSAHDSPAHRERSTPPVVYPVTSCRPGGSSERRRRAAVAEPCVSVQLWLTIRPPSQSKLPEPFATTSREGTTGAGTYILAAVVSFAELHVSAKDATPWDASDASPVEQFVKLLHVADAFGAA